MRKIIYLSMTIITLITFSIYASACTIHNRPDLKASEANLIKAIVSDKKSAETFNESSITLLDKDIALEVEASTVRKIVEGSDAVVVLHSNESELKEIALKLGDSYESDELGKRQRRMGVIIKKNKKGGYVFNEIVAEISEKKGLNFFKKDDNEDAERFLSYLEKTRI